MKKPFWTDIFLKDGVRQSESVIDTMVTEYLTKYYKGVPLEERADITVRIEYHSDYGAHLITIKS